MTTVAVTFNESFFARRNRLDITICHLFEARVDIEHEIKSSNELE